MARRKISKAQVEQAYEVAEQAKQNALYSLRKSKQLKDGADKMYKDYKASLPKKSAKQPTAKQAPAPKAPPKKTATKKETAKNTPWWAREEGE